MTRLFATLLVLSMTTLSWAGKPEKAFSLKELIRENKLVTSGFELEYKGKMLQLTALKQGGSITFSSGNDMWNFSPFVHLVCEVQNLSANELLVETHLNGDYWSTGAGYVPMKETREIQTLILRKKYSEQQLKLFPKMNGLPGGATRLWAGYSPDSIVSFTLDFPRIQPHDRLIIKRVELTTPYKDKEYEELLPFVDPFGQYAHAQYPGKIKKMNDIVVADKKEEQQFRKYTGNKTWNIYGGWANGPQLRATGHFRVEKYQGKWWFIDPLGHLFWSHGITCVAGGDDTNITGREKFYRSPFLNADEKADSLLFMSSQNGSTSISYWRLNMYRKWGRDFEVKMIDKANRRLKSWNINTIANWSNQKVIDVRKVPYTATIHVQHGHLPPDPFDADFQEYVESIISRSPAATDKWCIGYFVDNEIGWGNNTQLGVLAIKGHYAAAKRAFKDRLLEKYESLAKLNQSWKSNFATWEAWMKNDSIYKGATADLVDFTTHFANTYFRSIKNALIKKAPYKLYLGCRFNYGDYAGNPYQQWIVNISAKYCDVVSFNRYTYSAYSLRPSADLDFPMIIGEYHFGGLDRGLLHGGLRYGGTQENRADLYKHYVEDAIQNPYIVGTHWFQYNDQAVTGRGDGENYQIGFINVYDAPNHELVEAARLTGEKMYELRSK